jgi:hypothetical protein
MTLVYNVLITGHFASKRTLDKIQELTDRGNLSYPNKLDILKYCLSSTAVAYPWTRAIIKVELDTPYNTEENLVELKEFIQNEFKNTDLIFSPKRNIHQQDWKDTYNLIEDDLLFLQCNHDHVFIDNSTEYLHQLTLLKEQYKENFYIALSHYPEHIRTSKCGYIDLGRGETKSSSPWKEYKAKNNHIHVIRESYESIAIITKQLYKSWFVDGEWDVIRFAPNTFKSNKLELGRTEGAGVIGLGEVRSYLNLPTLELNHIIPYKEIFRHFDGYWHQKISNNHCPSLDIPSGFFENDIKIRYGYDDYKEGWVNINPKNPNYYAHDKSGTDYKFTLSDLPLAWKSRITTIDSNPEVDEGEMVQHRLKSILETIYSNQYYNSYIEDEVANKILEQHLQAFPKYKLT